VYILLGEDEQADLFRDKKILQRSHDISSLTDKEKDCMITTIDHFIKALILVHPEKSGIPGYIWNFISN
jgi:hypothetical protein